jgi:hypothetical protein
MKLEPRKKPRPCPIQISPTTASDAAVISLPRI